MLGKPGNSSWWELAKYELPSALCTELLKCSAHGNHSGLAEGTVLCPTQILVGSGNPLLPGSSGGPRSGSPGSTYLVPGDVRPSFLGQVPVYLSDCPFSGNITTKMLMNLYHFPWAKTHQHISLKKESRCFKKEASESKCLISVNALV